MAKVDPIFIIQALHGKIDSKSDTMFVTNSNTGSVNTRKIGKRDTTKHPVTQNEINTHLKMQKATAAYHELKQDIEMYQQFMEAFEEAVRDGWQSDLYHYFLHLWLDDGKNSDAIKTAKSKSSVESYIQGMRQCKTIEEADRLLLAFVEKLGYKKLAQAYKEIRKEIICKQSF